MIALRKASTNELRHRFDDLSWYEWKGRRAARREVSAGLVETLSVRVVRAWRLFSCEGAPCCPNDWLLETDSAECLLISSWRHLQPADNGMFPGSELLVTRWPESQRVVRVEVSGAPPSTVEASMQQAAALPDHWLRCVVVETMPWSPAVVNAP